MKQNTVYKFHCLLDFQSKRCEIFAVNSEIPNPLESAIQKTKEMSIRGREERRSAQGQTDKDYSLFRASSRGRSNERGRPEQRYRDQNYDKGGQRYNGPRERLRTPDRNMSRDRQSRRDDSQTRGYNSERRFSGERRHPETDGSRNRERENYRTYEREGNRERSRESSDWRKEQRPREDNFRSYETTGGYRRGNSETERINRYRERDSSRLDRYTSRTGGYRERDNSRTGRYNDRSQSRDRNSWRTVPQNKRNLEGVEFPPKTLMDLTVRFCVKCHNTLEEHYPWDCKLYRYWSNSPCDICYNGQHRAKECRKNPSRIDAFTVMLENPKATNTDQKNSTFSPF